MRPLRRLATVAGLVVAVMTSLDAQRLVFTARKDIVRVDVLVTDGGAIVRGLSAADFDVFDNGVHQDVELISAEMTPLDAIMAFDLSGSVAGETLGHLKRAGHAVVDALAPREQAALITFSQSVSLGVGLTADRGRLHAAIDDARPVGETSLVDASYAALVMGETDRGRALVVVFSDGLDTSSWLTSNEVLSTARRTSAVVYAVSIGNLPRVSFLRDLSAATGGTLFEVDSTKDLDGLFTKVLSEFRERYLISYSPNGVVTDGWHRITVSIKGHKTAVIKARPGYER